MPCLSRFGGFRVEPGGGTTRNLPSRKLGFSADTPVAPISSRYVTVTLCTPNYAAHQALSGASSIIVIP